MNHKLCFDLPFTFLFTFLITVPDAPEALRVLQVTTNQVKLGWSPPEFDNGALKCYYVYNGKHQVESTPELSCIVSGLAPGTSYDLYVSKQMKILMNMGRILKRCLK